jgi:purine-binding chemotaxis protein CheW
VERAPGDASDEEAGGKVASHRLLLFVLGGRLYGCDIGAVREVVPYRDATRLPGAPPYVCGLINLRGTIVTVLDLGLRVGSKAVDRNEGSIILVDVGSKLAGLAVDEVRDVQPVSEEQVEAGPEDDAGIVRGLARLGDTVVVLLDVRSVVRQVLV